MWHETWRSLKGRAKSLADVASKIGRPITATQMAVARKAAGVVGKLRHGRYEYTEREVDALVEYFRSKHKEP